VKCGVLQGSILGPILFSLYENNLPTISKFSIRLFADDTILIMNDKNLENLNKTENLELEKIQRWLSSNKHPTSYVSRSTEVHFLH